MKFDLPTETWADLFGFLTRLQLAKLVTQIEDWYFASKAQFYLHECGQITLGHMRITKSLSANGNGPAAIIKTDRGVECPLADSKMPANIRNFKGITISYFDDSVLRFLQEFQRNSLLTDVKLQFHKRFFEIGGRLAYFDWALPRLMNKIMPLITSIERIFIENENENYTGLLAILDGEYSEKMLASARVLKIREYVFEKCSDEWLYNWLNTPRGDGKPRVLFLRLGWYESTTTSSFIEHVKKNFLDPNQPAFSLYIQVLTDCAAVNFPSYSLDNGQKKREKLVVKGIGHAVDRVTILRYPIGASEEWIEGMGKDSDCEYANIEIDI